MHVQATYQPVRTNDFASVCEARIEYWREPVPSEVDLILLNDQNPSNVVDYDPEDFFVHFYTPWVP